MSKHTSGLWATRNGRIFPVGKEQSTIASISRDIQDWTLFNEDDARRIVACVNACEGIGTEELELCKLSSLDAVHKLLGFKKEHDELLATLEALYRDYVQVMEAGRDRIMDLGGHCDPIDVMERGDPRLIDARKAIAKAKGGAA